MKTYGKFVFFPESWSAESWKDGIIRIGSTLIVTDPDPEDGEEFAED